MKIRIELPIIPPKNTGQSGKKLTTIGGHASMYETKESKATKNMYYALLMPFRPKEPFSGALRITYYFLFPYLSTTKKTIVKNALIIPKTTKPDFDNIPKQIQDQLTLLQFWSDDAIIYDGRVVKVLSSTPKIVVDIENEGNSLEEITKLFQLRGIIK